MREKVFVRSLLVLFLAFGVFLLPNPALAAIPDKPSNLIVVAGSSTSIALSWQDNSTNEESFDIWRKVQGEAAFSYHATVGANVHLYYESGLEPATTYYYKVHAHNSDGYSDFSNTASDNTNPLAIQLTSPNGGEVWKALEHHNITWTSDAEGYMIRIMYKTDTVGWTEVAEVPNTNSYDWTIPNLDSTQVRIRVTAFYPGRASYITDQSDADFTIQPFTISVGPFYTFPNAPTSLSCSYAEPHLTLNWTDNSNNEDGFKIERRVEGEDFAQIGTVATNITTFVDSDLTAGTEYTYRVRAYNPAFNSTYSNEVSFTPTASGSSGSSSSGTTGNTVVRFTIDSREYYVQGPGDASPRVLTMDTAPIILGGRTLLPITYVTTPLGATVAWDDALDQVTVQLSPNTIVLWINNGTARVNGVSTAIDPLNPEVTPIIVDPGRTMLPLSFIAANLGCDVQWNAATREVTVTYPAAS